MPSATDRHRRQDRTKRLALSSMFAALALIFSYIEAILPFSVGIPGVKLGIANLVVIIALYEMGLRYALTINVIRIFVAGLLFNGLFGAVYSLAGGLLSLLIMWLLKKNRTVQHDRGQYGRRCSPQHGTAVDRVSHRFRPADVPVTFRC